MPTQVITTDRQFASLKPLECRFERRVSGARGLSLRVWPSGLRQFEVRYAVKDGPRRHVILGDYPEVSLADARQKATQLRLELLKGVDPIAERAAALLPAPPQDSVDDVAEAYWAAEELGLPIRRGSYTPALSRSGLCTMINPDPPSNLTPYPPPADLDRRTETTIHQLLKAHGLLLNCARRDVLHVLLLAQHPLDVDGALGAARASGSHVSRAAVSRFLNLLNRLGVAEVAARRNARRFFRLWRETQTISLSCVQQNRIIEVQDDAVVEAVQRLLHGMGYRLAEGIHFRIEPLSGEGVFPALNDHA